MREEERERQSEKKGKFQVGGRTQRIRFTKPASTPFGCTLRLETCVIYQAGASNWKLVWLSSYTHLAHVMHLCQAADFLGTEREVRGVSTLDRIKTAKMNEWINGVLPMSPQIGELDQRTQNWTYYRP